MATHIDFACPHCGTVNGFHVSRLGKPVDCLMCSGIFIPPVPTARAVAMPSKPAKRKKLSVEEKTMAVVLLAFILFIGVVVVREIGTPGIGDAHARHNAATAGDTKITGTGQRIVCDTENTLDLVLSAANNNSTEAFAAYVMDGRAWLVGSGTKVAIVDWKTHTRKIQILEGPHAGKTGWVPSEFVR